MADGPSRSEPVSGLRPPARAGWSVTETLATAASVLWLVIVVVFLTLPALIGVTADPFLPLTVAVAIVLPVALIWVAARSLRAARTAQDDIRRLTFALDAQRQSMLADRQARAIATVSPPRPEAAPVAPPPARTPPRPSAPAASVEDQPSLSLGGEAEESGPPLSHMALIRALHFPNDDRDDEGFAALRSALADRRTRQLIQASQDVLTLMSQDGIYMDDIDTDRSRPELWRRFARGERGGAIAGLGGVQDKECLAIATGRLRQDAIFRDATHHFLRLFDRRLSALEPDATDEDLVLLAETRTARAFMLLGRVTGIFD